MEEPGIVNLNILLSSTQDDTASDENTEWLCQRCAACCRWPGDVILEEGEATAIAAFLEMGEMSFIQNHTRLSANRRFLSLMESDSGACEFLDGIECRVQPVKPKQCRGFPNEWRFPGWKDFCQAIPVSKGNE